MNNVTVALYAPTDSRGNGGLSLYFPIYPISPTGKKEKDWIIFHYLIRRDRNSIVYSFRNNYLYSLNISIHKMDAKEDIEFDGNYFHIKKQRLTSSK